MAVTLLLILLGGALALGVTIVLLEAGWRADPWRSRPPVDLRDLCEDLERDATTALLTGRITRERYRAAVAAAASGHPAASDRSAG